MYCDECGQDYWDGECPYHDFTECPECHEVSLQLHRGGPSPEDPDYVMCHDCGWEENA